MATRWTRPLASLALAASLLAPSLIEGTGAGARPRIPPTTCPGPSECAAPWMAYLTNLTLGRAPQDSDYTTFGPTDDVAQIERRIVATDQLTSLAGRRFTVELYYFRVLQRPADPSGADFWPRAMVDGRRNTERLEASLLGSNEFSRKWPDWITQMYDVVLARQPDPQGYAYWTTKATQMSHERVARLFLATAPARRERARLIYAALYAAPDLPPPTAGDITDAANLLAHFTGEDELIVTITTQNQVYEALQTT